MKSSMTPAFVLGVGMLPGAVFSPSITSGLVSYFQMIGYAFLGVHFANTFISGTTANSSDQGISEHTSIMRCLGSYGALLSLGVLVQASSTAMFSYDLTSLLSGSLVGQDNLMYSSTTRLTSIFPHSIYLGMALIIPVYACASLLRNERFKTAHLLLLIMCLFGILMSGSRGAIIFIIPAIFFTFKFSPKSVLISSVATALVFPIVTHFGATHLDRVFDTITFRSEGNELSSNLQRIYLWTFALDGFLENPIAGHGLGAFKEFQAENASYLLQDYGIGEDNLTQYAGVAYEAGLVGLITLILVLFWPLKARVLITCAGTNTWFLQAGFAAVLLNNTFQNNLFTRGTWVVTWFTFGLLFVLYRRSSIKSATRHSVTAWRWSN